MGISIDEVPERHNSKPKPETSVPHFIWGNLRLWALPDPALFLPTLPFHLSPSLAKDSFHSHSTSPKLITVFKRNHQWLDFAAHGLLDRLFSRKSTWNPFSFRKWNACLGNQEKKVAFLNLHWKLEIVCQSWGFSHSGNWAAFPRPHQEQRLHQTRVRRLGSTVPLLLISCVTLG